MRHKTQQQSLICFSFAKEYESKIQRQLIAGLVVGMALFCCSKSDDDLKYKEQEGRIWAMPTIMIVHLRHAALIDRDEKYFTVEMLKNKI